MKKSVSLVVLFLSFFICTVSFAQNTETNVSSDKFVDGMIYVKLIDAYPLIYTVNGDKTINFDQIPFIQRLSKKYSITTIRQDFTLNDDPKLLRTLTLLFENKEVTDKLIRKLEKSRYVEYVERVPVKRMMQMKAVPVKIDEN